MNFKSAWKYEGWMEGDAVGSRVGWDVVGTAVGCTVGAIVGSAVGCVVGRYSNSLRILWDPYSDKNSSLIVLMNKW